MTLTTNQKHYAGTYPLHALRATKTLRATKNICKILFLQSCGTDLNPGPAQTGGQVGDPVTSDPTDGQMEKMKITSHDEP